MSLDRGDFEALSEEDLQELVAGQVPEGLRLDYKLTSYGGGDADKREFLKDLSALANSSGGHLLLGIAENEGVASAIPGIAGDVDAEKLRLEQIARSGLEPRVSGIRMTAVTLQAGSRVLAIRVPRSWAAPHRVIAQGSNKFYLRHSAGVHEPSVEELRMLFTQSASALDRAREFRDQRLVDIRNEVGIRPLVGGGRLIFHIVPVAAFSGAINIDVRRVHELHQAFGPIGASGMNPQFNYLGFINERGGDQNHGYTQIFRNGSLEATYASIRRGDQGRGIPGAAIERHLFGVVHSYIAGLRDLGVPPPLILMVTLEGVGGATYTVAHNIFHDAEPLLPEEIMRLPECVLQDYGTEVDHHRALRPAFDALWNAIGYAQSRFFNADGRWVGPH